MPGDPAANAVIGHGLQRGIIEQHREIHGELRTEPAFPGEAQLRTQIDGSDSRVRRRFTPECISVFVFAGNYSLERQCISTD